MMERKRQHLIFAGITLVTGILLIWRCFYGFNSSDEMYMVATSERLFRGEKILIDEWNPTQQMCSFLLYPIYYMIRSALGSTEGIILANRFLFVAFQLLISVFCYLKLQKRGWISFGPILLYLFFAPFALNIMSYNSMEIGFMTLLLVILSDKPEHSVPEYILCGMLMAFVILANPFAILLYLGYGVLCLIFTIRGKIRRTEAEGTLQLRSFLWMTLGAFIVLVLFLLFVFERGTIQEVLANLPHIVNDPEHKQGVDAYILKFQKYFHYVHKNYRYMIYGLAGILWLVLADKKRYAHKTYWMAAATICVVPYLFYYGFVYSHIPINHLMLPLSFYGLAAYAVTEKKQKRIFCWWYLPAMAFTMIVHMASNTGILMISSAYSIGSAAAILLIGNCFHEISEESGSRMKRFAIGSLLWGTIALQFAGLIYLRATYECGDARVQYLNTKMERGPLKNIHTTKDGADWYAGLLEELDAMELTEEDELLVVGVAPFAYLYTEAGCGSYSTWQVHQDSVQLFDYYELHPDKFPDVVYMIHWREEFLESNLAKMFFAHGYQVYEVNSVGDRAILRLPEQTN